jgi:TrmH family RNA methyltransferase
VDKVNRRTRGQLPGEHEHSRSFVVVLQETQDVVNIAGVMRAMMNMGLGRLRLVDPVEFTPHRIEGIAHGSGPLIERTELFATLDEAIADCAFVAGASARPRTAAYVWQHPREAAQRLLGLAAAGAGPVALLFGREDKGLTNTELDRCDLVLTIPTDESYPSLNLAQAVLLIAYELWLAGPGAERELPRARKAVEPVGAAEFARMMTDVQLTLERIEFFKKRNPEAILRGLRALARRADLDGREAGLLRAIAIEVRKYLDRKLSL